MISNSDNSRFIHDSAEYCLEIINGLSHKSSGVMLSFSARGESFRINTPNTIPKSISPLSDCSIQDFFRPLSQEHPFFCKRHFSGAFRSADQELLLFDASEEMLAIGVTALRIMAVGYLLSHVCLTYSAAFQGLSMGVQSMLLTLGRQVVLPVAFLAVLSRFGNLSLIWMAFVLAEAVVIPFGMFFWRKESGKVLEH